jgi:hypothetical protein
MSVLLLGALLATVAAAWVIGPLAARRAAVLVDAAPGALLDAEARRRAALASLKELEYDFLAGKLDEADYRAQRDRMGLETLAAMRAAESAERAVVGERAERPQQPAHACGFVNPERSRFCAGCGQRLR